MFGIFETCASFLYEKYVNYLINVVTKMYTYYTSIDRGAYYRIYSLLCYNPI